MITAKIIVGLIGLGVGIFGTAMSAPAAAAPMTDTAIVTVSGSAGIIANDIVGD